MEIIREQEIRQSKTHRPTVESQEEFKTEEKQNYQQDQKSNNLFAKSQEKEESKEELKEISYISKLQNSLVFIPGQEENLEDKLVTSDDMIILQKSDPNPLSMNS